MGTVAADVWAVTTALWLLFVVVRSSRFSHFLLQLADTEFASSRTAWPKISLVVPACNEAPTIEAAARSLLNLDYPNIEFILVDDRSTDATGKIIDVLAAEDSRVRPVHITDLPAGWLGKVNAMASAARVASGDWLLFTDADVHYSPQALKKAVAHCESYQLDYLTVLPWLLAKTTWLRVFLVTFSHLLSALLPLGKNGRGFAGVGAFLFLRREMLAKSEGFAWLRLEVIDDAAMAFLMLRTGARMGVAGGNGEVGLEWYPSFPALVRGVEKNFFAGLRYSLTLVLFVLGLNLLACGGVLVAPFLAGSVWIGVLVWASLCLCLGQIAFSREHILAMPAWETLLTPIAFAAFPWIALRSAIINLRNGGVRWRSTFYSLSELRANQRFSPKEIFRARVKNS